MPRVWSLAPIQKSWHGDRSLSPHNWRGRDSRALGFANLPAQPNWRIPGQLRDPVRKNKMDGVWERTQLRLVLCPSSVLTQTCVLIWTHTHMPHCHSLKSLTHMHTHAHTPISMHSHTHTHTLPAHPHPQTEGSQESGPEELTPHFTEFL